LRGKCPQSWQFGNPSTYLIYMCIDGVLILDVCGLKKEKRELTIWNFFNLYNLDVYGWRSSNQLSVGKSKEKESWLFEDPST
jgi:hypothetical protein